MTQLAARTLVLLVLLAALCSPALAQTAPVAASAADDEIPGVLLPASPVVDSLHSDTDPDDVYRVVLSEGDVVQLQLAKSAATAGFAPRVAIFGPRATSVDNQDEVAVTLGTGFPKSLSYTATATGVYYINVFHDPNVPGESGTTTLTWRVLSPVYRFYNAANATHFFTPSLDEQRMVVALWSNVYTFEGVAYHTQPFRNPQPLYRFYNRRSASHFYTASADERNAVIAKWSNVFTYEGETYKVALGGPAEAAVYRFYHRGNGSHFYTASAQERDTVIARWSNVYTYEGPAFYLNP